jgi:hypothetical protein
MIKKFFLPNPSALFETRITDPRESDLSRDSFTGPLLPFLHEDWQRFRV